MVFHIWLKPVLWGSQTLPYELIRSSQITHKDIIFQNRKKDTDVQNRLLDSVGEGEGGMFQEDSIETCILSIVKQITSPGWMHESSARAGCTGKTWRNRVEREVGRGIGTGNTCKSMADSCQCMTKTTTIL